MGGWQASGGNLTSPPHLTLVASKPGMGAKRFRCSCSVSKNFNLRRSLHVEFCEVTDDGIEPGG